MSRIDLSKLPAPQIIEELNFETILADMRRKMTELCPDWTGYALESDPANKVMEVAAYREMLLRQRVNEAARGVMVAFAAGGDLDHLAAFYPEERLPGAAATFRALLKLSAALDVDVTIPSAYTVVAKNGAIEALLRETVTIYPGLTETEGIFEIIKPSGAEGNGLFLTWDAVTPLPFVTAAAEQLEASHGGSDAESDEDFRRRVPLALERYSTAGPKGSYEAWALKAEERVKDVSATTPEPGVVHVYLLSKEGDGTADEAMISRVREILNDDGVRPLTDEVEIFSANIIHYEVRMTVEIYPGVAGEPPYEEARRRVRAKVQNLHGLGMDITRTALMAAAHVEGVKLVELLEPSGDIGVSASEAAYCMNIEVGSRVADEP